MWSHLGDSFWPPFMVYISVTICHRIPIWNNAQMTLNHSNTGLVCYSDPQCIISFCLGCGKQEAKSISRFSHLRCGAHTRPPQQMVLPRLHVRSKGLPQLLVWDCLLDVEEYGHDRVRGVVTSPTFSSWRHLRYRNFGGKGNCFVLVFHEYCRYPSIKPGLKGNRSCCTSA